MKRTTRWFLTGARLGALVVVMVVVMVVRVPAAAGAAETKPAYENDFEQAALEKVPDDFLVLDGGFAVKQEEGNKFLELPGAPLDTYGVLFGPTEASGLEVSARIHGTAKGRRFPTFAVGVNGVGGYKLQLSPAKKALELFKGEEVVASTPFTWATGAWTHLRLRCVRVASGGILVQGRAWKQGDPEPKEWGVSRPDPMELPAGRPSVWGMPFAGTPIRFDDLKVQRVP